MSRQKTLEIRDCAACPFAFASGIQWLCRLGPDGAGDQKTPLSARGGPLPTAMPGWCFLRTRTVLVQAVPS